MDFFVFLLIRKDQPNQFDVQFAGKNYPGVLHAPSN